MSAQQANLIREWLRALRSGGYTQGTDCLRNADGAFCCLGVACDIVDSSRWSSSSDIDRTPDQFNEANGEDAVSDVWPGDIQAKFGLTNEETSALWEMNDSGSATFSEIADHIECSILPRVEAEVR